MKVEKKQEGFFIDGEKVKFAHFRVIDLRGNVDPRGGATVAYFGDKDTVDTAGIAYCSYDDNFNYAYGRQKAVGRLAQGICNEADGDDITEAEEKAPKFVKDLSREELTSFMDVLGFDRR